MDLFSHFFGVTSLHLAAESGDVDKVRELLQSGKYNVNCTDSNGKTPLHYACAKGHLDMVKVLIARFNADVLFKDVNGCIPLIDAALNGWEHVVLTLLNEYLCPSNIRSKDNKTLLHWACYGGNVSLVQTLIRDHKADINARNDENDTPLHVAALGGEKKVALFLINEVGCDINITGYKGRSLLHIACKRGNVSLVQTLIRDHKADINARDDENNTPLHVAALFGEKEVASFLINEVGCDINIKGYKGRSLLHIACKRGNVSLVQTLIRDHKADINARDDENNTPLHVAALFGEKEVASFLINEVGCDINVKGNNGRSLLHKPCNEGNVRLVQTLIHDYKADINARDNENNTPLHVAALCGKKEVALFLINEVGCDIFVTGNLGRSLLHSACKRGNVSLVQTLIRDHKADINARDDENNTPLHVAALYGKKEVALFLINEVGCDINVEGYKGQSLLHSACKGGNVSLVQTLIQDHRADINARDDNNNTPLHVAALFGEKEVALFLINEVSCDINVKGYKGQSLLHIACKGGNVSLVQTLIRDHKADINARDHEKDTPLHVAALAGKEEVISPLVIDNDGDTPLHISSALGHTKCVEVLLQKNAPISIRNNSGKTPKDLAKGDAKLLINEYLKQNRDKTLVDYHGMQEQAKKKYSGAQRIIRLFIVGNPGAGKSSLVESLKREGFFESFWRVSESTVPPHTAGIVPSIYTSKHYGRVQFYDFAGDPEYYSSHAAILENLASSSKGDNIFILVTDLREDDSVIENTLHYWLTFLKHQKFNNEPFLIVIGSHSDLMTQEILIQKNEVLKSLLYTSGMQGTAYFMLDCCKPGSKSITEVRKSINLFCKSQHYRISFEASILLGLLEKDFSNVTACPVSTLVSHIEDTGVHLPNKTELLHPILHELHDVGILLLIGDRTKHDYHIILNTSQLTNRVHKVLFSKDAILNIKKMSERGCVPTLNIGIIPENLLQELLPSYITKECLVHLQYCQEIKHRDIRQFLSTPQDSSSSPQSFLFFPALCSVDKSDESWTTPPDRYSIGWLAQCTDPYDYFPPRFLHVLLLRIVFKFTLTAEVRLSAKAKAASTDPFYKHNCQRRCTMWKTGIHWRMEEGAECILEMVNVNKGVMVIIRCERDFMYNCISVFNSIVSCVMVTMKDFCHSIKLQFFLLDSTQQDNYLSEDNLFTVNDVERVLTSSEEKQVVVSVSGKREIKRSDLLWMCTLTHWNTLFQIDFSSVYSHLKAIVKELFDLGLQLDIPSSVLETIEVQYPTDVDRQRRELVRKWMSPSQDLPCWWHLVEALTKIGKRAIADEIEEECGEWLNLRISCVEVYHCPTGDHIQLQKKLLDPKLQTITPDVEFLELFAGVVGSKWSSLACLLSLTSEEIEEVKTEEEERAFLMLKKWSSKEGATYGQLCNRLKTISLFQYV